MNYFIVLSLTVIIVALLTIAVYLRDLINLQETKLTADYGKEIARSPVPKPKMKAVKQKLRGRSVVKSDDLIDLADVDFEEAYRAAEDIGK